jgi:fructokinase
MAVPPGSTALEQFVATARADNAVTISMDLNLRPSILGDRERETERVHRQLRHAHIAKASDEDIAWLYPGVPVADVATRWQALGVACVIITLGADGAYLLMPDGSTHRQPGLAVPVVDTVGAGDAFTGGVLAALGAIGGLGADPLARLTSVTGAEWRWVMDHATIVAALTCTRRGANPPTLDETTQPIPRSIK